MFFILTLIWVILTKIKASTLPKTNTAFEEKKAKSQKESSFPATSGVLLVLKSVQWRCDGSAAS